MTLRPYGGPQDIALLLEFTADAIAAAGHCGFMHVGDVPHRSFNAGRNEELDRIVGIGEEGDWVRKRLNRGS